MKISVVILAAGKGTRMGATDRPKVMFEANGKPLVEYLIKSIKTAGVEDVTLVVGYMQEMVQNYFKDTVKYVEQREQFGTGHAVLMAKGLLQGKSDAVIVSYGDMPCYKTETIKKLIKLFEEEKPTIAMVTVDLREPSFWGYSRVIRDKNGNILATVEDKDCNEEQAKIHECNPSFYMFNADFLWENLEKIGTNNVQGEYYLPDLISIAAKSGGKVVNIKTDTEQEVLGVNTPEQLREVEKILESTTTPLR
jgi:UDP-N-acetylglucosamine diphosphorylase/glucosamine-1-phosphate N-acetyltransferase